MNELKPIPEFQTEYEEREFWATHDSTDYVDWSKAQFAPSLKNLQQSEDLLELVLPKALTPKLKALAKQKLLSQEELVQRYIAEGIARDSSLRP